MVLKLAFLVYDSIQDGNPIDMEAKNMNCRECQKRVSDYLKDKLDRRELESFIKHVNSCTDCYEELEIMFTLTVGLMQLEEEINSYNFKIALKDKLKHELRECINYRVFYNYRNTIVAMAYILVLLGVIIQILTWL